MAGPSSEPEPLGLDPVWAVGAAERGVTGSELCFASMCRQRELGEVSVQAERAAGTAAATLQRRGFIGPIAGPHWGIKL